MNDRLPRYPAYRRDKPRSHVLATDDNTHLRMWDDGAELGGADPLTILPSQSYDEWIEQATTHSLDVRCWSLLHWRYFKDAVRDERATIAGRYNTLDTYARPVSITWRVGNKWATLYQADAWDGDLSRESMRSLRDLCDELGVGVYASPSALGQSTMTNLMVGSEKTVSGACRDDLLDHLVGGRSETVYGRWDQAYEIDRRMAYVAEARNELPVGTATPFSEDADADEAWRQPMWFARCQVVLPTRLPLGPFPFRSADGQITYPTAPGIYQDVWLWKGEAEDCRTAGCLVSLRNGWAWSRTRAALAGWSDWIYRRRVSAPTTTLADLTKRVAVAALGWHAMSPTRYRIRHAEGRETCLAVSDAQGTPTDYVAEEEYDEHACQMVHWISFIWSEARRAIYHRGLQEIERGNRIFQIDTDSLLLAAPSVLPLSSDLGQFRELVRTNVRIHAPRSYVSDERRKLPGVPRETQEQFVERLLLREYNEARWKEEHPAEWARERARRAKKSGSHFPDWWYRREA